MKSSTSRTVPTCWLNSEQSSWVTPPGLSMKTRTTGERAPPAISTWTSSRPRSRAARSAIPRTRASTELSSPNAPDSFQNPLARKRKSGPRTHWTTPQRSEQEADYTGCEGARQASEVREESYLTRKLQAQKEPGRLIGLSRQSLKAV